jgi:hypothetical protein
MSQLRLKLCSSNTILYPGPTSKLCPDIPTLNLSPACNLICNIIHDCVLPINYYQAAPHQIPAMYPYYDPNPYLRKPTNNVLALSLMSHLYLQMCPRLHTYNPTLPTNYDPQTSSYSTYTLYPKQ